MSRRNIDVLEEILIKYSQHERSCRRVSSKPLPNALSHLEWHVAPTATRPCWIVPRIVRARKQG